MPILGQDFFSAYIFISAKMSHPSVMDTLFETLTTTMSPETLEALQGNLYWMLILGFVIAIFLGKKFYSFYG